MYNPNIHATPKFITRKFRFRRQAVPITDAMPIQVAIPAEVVAGTAFYLDWERKIAEATSDVELRELVRQIVTLDVSSSTKDEILKIIDRQYDIIRRR